MSLTSLDDRTQIWRQAWADSSGNFWTFQGGLERDRMVLTTDRPDHQGVLKRMVFFDIESDRLEWLWERSDDGGRTWRPLWTIHYERQGPGDETPGRRGASPRFTP